jgi:hypothetical protein
MDKALWNSAQAASARRLDWRRKISDNVAYALLVYTGIQIYVTMGALKVVAAHSALPYFGLVVLVAAIIPGCRMIERRWEGLSNEQAELAPRYRRDRLVIWGAAIVLPFVITGVIRGIELFI